MARKGVVINVASDTRDFTKGIQSGVIEPLEDVSRELENVAKEGARAGDKLEDSMRDAQRRTEDLADEHKQLHEVIEQGSRTSYRKMTDTSHDSMRRASDDVDEFKDEAKQNWSEVASSFSGDMDSAVDLVQGTLGGLASSIPGYGLALGALAAAGGAFYQSWKDNSEKTQQRISDMFDDMADSGQNYLSATFIQQTVSDIISGADGAITSLDNVKRLAEEAGVPVQEMLLALAGDETANTQVLDAVNTKLQDVRDNSNAAREGVSGIGAGTTTAALNDAADLLNEVAGNVDSAANRADLLNSTLSRMDGASSTDAEARRFANLTDAINNAGAAVTAIPDANVRVGIDTTAFDNGIRSLVNARRTVQVQAEFITRDGKRVL